MKHSVVYLTDRVTNEQPRELLISRNYAQVSSVRRYV